MNIRTAKTSVLAAALLAAALLSLCACASAQVNVALPAQPLPAGAKLPAQYVPLLPPDTRPALQSAAPVDAAPSNGVLQTPAPAAPTAHAAARAAAVTVGPPPAPTGLKATPVMSPPDIMDFTPLDPSKITVKILGCDASGVPVSDGTTLAAGDHTWLYIIIHNTNAPNMTASIRIVTTPTGVASTALPTAVTQDATAPALSATPVPLPLSLPVLVASDGTGRTLTAGTIKLRLPVALIPNLTDPSKIPASCTFSGILDSQLGNTGALMFIRYPSIPPRSSFSVKVPMTVQGAPSVTTPNSEWTLAPSRPGGPVTAVSGPTATAPGS